jgi:hypothetical protein
MSFTYVKKPIPGIPDALTKGRYEVYKNTNSLSRPRIYIGLAKKDTKSRRWLALSNYLKAQDEVKSFPTRKEAAVHLLAVAKLNACDPRIRKLL